MAIWIQNYPIILISISLLGAGFLGFYGISALKKVLNNDYLELSLRDQQEGAPKNSARIAFLTAAFLSLNPASLSDTLLILPGLAAIYDFTGKVAFAAGSLTASLSWFCTLCFASKLMRKLFKSPKAWRILDSFIFVMMTYLAIKMLLSTLSYF